MQDNSNLRQPPKKHVCQRKMSLSKAKIPPLKKKNKMSGKKKYFTLYFIHLIHKACQILSASTSQCNCFHLYSQCLHLPTLTPNIPIPLTAISQHIIISPIHCIGYTALLKTLHCHFWWDVLPYCWDPHWLNTTFMYFLVYKHTWAHEDSQFSPQIMLVVIRI